MKKRTVITTEKRELWIISGGRVVRETPIHPPANAETDSTGAMIPSDQDSFQEEFENKVREKEATVSRQS